MSFITPIVSFLSSAPGRSISNITGFITVNESTTDTVEVTKQPVQQGAMIADHAFVKPIALSMQIQFQPATLTTALTNLAGSLFSATPTPNQSSADTYQQILALQNALQPIIVTTPKRTYSNMLITSVGVTTDKKTENVLAVSIAFEEILIVSVTAVSVPRSKLRNAGKNGATVKAGKKSAALVIAQAINASIQGSSQ